MEEVKPVDWTPFQAEFPTLFHGAELAEMDVGEGWTVLLWNLCAELEVIATREDGAPFPFRIFQIKEKFGGLRFYLRGHTPLEVGTLIQEAEARSEGLCEACGAPGARCVIENWIKTLCVAHQVRLSARSSHGGPGPTPDME